jgi:hypothetical protein
VTQTYRSPQATNPTFTSRAASAARRLRSNGIIGMWEFPLRFFAGNPATEQKTPLRVLPQPLENLKPYLRIFDGAISDGFAEECYHNSTMQTAIAIMASVLSGGLAGACVSAVFNRLSHWRELRTKFYPTLNNMHSAYVIRMENPEGRYWTTVVGNIPAPEDEVFVDHRASFMSDLVQYNELKEVRDLRKKMLDNAMSGDHNPGEVAKLDLAPESVALNACLITLHKKLRI